MKDLILIVGHGRSGTNWLLGMLDFSSRTHCRNEPNEIESSPLFGINSYFVDHRKDELLDSKWGDATEWAGTRFGYRDLIPEVHKDHFHRTSLPLGLTKIVRRHRTRKILRFAMPYLARPEWEMPWWLGSRRRLADAIVVLKTLGIAGWVDWIARRRKDLMIIHLVRHPGGFLNSWDKRYLQVTGEAKVREDNRQRLHQLVEADASWGERLGDIDSMEPHESELWFWMYCTEAIHSAGSKHHRYRRILYEELTGNPVEIMREVYSDCRLPWDESIERRISSRSRTSGALAAAWRKSLPTDQVALIQRILQGSLAEKWWDDVEGSVGTQDVEATAAR